MFMRITVVAGATLLLAACGGGSSGGAPVDQVPTVSGIADVTIDANNASSPIAFAVTDDDVAGLAIDAMSDNESLIASDAIETFGSGTARSLVVTPTADSIGDAEISIVLTDSAGQLAGTTFRVTVDPERRSMLTFTRDGFTDDADDIPTLVNAIDFEQDADDDEFADLFDE
ncbi:MAG: hypothetical protein AAFZ58_04390 [Pseudomonadota bacterium]